MKENVGSNDQVFRILTGSAMILVGYAFLGGYRGSGKGLLTMMAGVATVESGITRVCPLNALRGIDTRTPWEMESDLDEAITLPLLVEERTLAGIS